MIKNFEEYTQDLSAEEMELVPFFIRAFSNYDKSKPIKSDDIINRFNANPAKWGATFKLTGPRLRKICNYIRTTGQLPLIATSSGYYVSYDPTEIQQQIKSLEQRANSIAGCAEGMRKWVRG